MTIINVILLLPGLQIVCPLKYDWQKFINQFLCKLPDIKIAAHNAFVIIAEPSRTKEIQFLLLLNDLMSSKAKIALKCVFKNTNPGNLALEPFEASKRPLTPGLLTSTILDLSILSDLIRLNFSCTYTREDPFRVDKAIPWSENKRLSRSNRWMINEIEFCFVSFLVCQDFPVGTIVSLKLFLRLNVSLPSQINVEI